MNTSTIFIIGQEYNSYCRNIIDNYNNFNIIKIFKIQDFKSDIDAEYFIESSNFNRQSTVYIFIRQRKESDNYVIVSFFKKHNIYKGNKAYWMLKEKITGDECIVLYQHPNYKKEE